MPDTNLVYKKRGSAVGDVGPDPRRLTVLNLPLQAAAARQAEAVRQAEAARQAAVAKAKREAEEKVSWVGVVFAVSNCQYFHEFQGDCGFEGCWCLSLQGCRVMVVDGGL